MNPNDLVFAKTGEPGITVRDYIAILICAQLAQNNNSTDAATMAYTYADALIDESNN